LPVANAPVVAPSNSKQAAIWTAVSIVGVASFVFWFSQSRAPKPKPARKVVAAAPVPKATPRPAAPVRVEAAVAPAPREERSAGPTAEDLARVQARMEAVRAMNAAQPALSQGDAAGGAAALDAWLATHPGHPERAAIERHVARARASAKVLPSLAERPIKLVGVTVPVGGVALPVTGITKTGLLFKVRAQFGLVERAVEFPKLSAETTLSLLGQIDAANGTALSATYLLGLGKSEAARARIPVTSPERDELNAAADEVQNIATESAVLALLENVGSLIGRGDLVAAKAELAKVSAHAAHDFVKIAYAPQLKAWGAKVASAPLPEAEAMPVAKASDDYPGVPILALSSAMIAGDPDRNRLFAAANWAAATGSWARHFTELKSALVKAVDDPSQQQRAAKVERIVVVPTAALAMEHARFIRAVGAGTLKKFTEEPGSRSFIEWLLARPAVLAAFSETIQPEDKAGEALARWRDIWADDEESREPLSNLAIACALVFDRSVGMNGDLFGFNRSSSQGASVQSKVEPLARFHFYRDCAKKGSLKVPLKGLTPWELTWVVDAPLPDTELVWAQKNVNYSRKDWGKAYGHIRYRMDRATQGVNPYKAYTLAEIEKEGGICGDQAYFAAMTAKANGIPAMVISGEGDRGAHAWFGYGIGRNDWNLNTGRYGDNYAAGTTRDAQTGRTIKEHELRQMTDPARRTPGWEKSERLMSLGTLFTDAGRDDLATIASDAALRSAPKNFAAWNAKLASLAKAKVPAEEWLRESARMRTAFREYPDLVAEINQREATYASKQGDAAAALKVVHRQTGRIASREGDRTDLILDSVMREAELAGKTDPAAAGRIYRDALRDKGEEVVGFRRVAESYYQWAKAQGKAPETVRDLVSYFDRKHDEPTRDVFAMGAYRGLLGMLAGMAKEQKLEPVQRKLERRAEKLKELEEKTGKADSRGADR